MNQPLGIIEGESLYGTTKIANDMLIVIEKILESHSSVKIFGLKDILKWFIEKNIFILKDTEEKSLTEQSIVISKGLWFNTVISELWLQVGDKIQLSGRKWSKVRKSEALSDIFWIYIFALEETFSALDTRRFLSTEKISRIIASVKRFKKEFDRVNNPESPSFLEYPYHITNFREFEEAIKLLPWEENFWLQFVPKERGIRFIEGEKSQWVVSTVKTATDNIINLPKKEGKISTQKRFFDYVPEHHMNTVYGFLWTIRKVKEDLELLEYFKSKKSFSAQVSKHLNNLTSYFYTHRKDDKFTKTFSTLWIYFVEGIQDKIWYTRGYIGETIGKDIRLVSFFSSVLVEYNNQITRDLIYKPDVYDSMAGGEEEYIDNCKWQIEKIIETQFRKFFPEIEI